jgi:GTPase SAR1 family protein
MPDVFISYSHKDAEPAAVVRATLENAGISVWQDIDRMQPSDQLAGTIASALNQVPFVVAVLSSSSEQSKWFSWETNYAITLGLQKGAPKVLPIKVEPCNTPLCLLAANHVDATGDVVGGARVLVKVIKQQGRLAGFGGAHCCNLEGETRTRFLDALEQAFPSPQLAVLFWRQLALGGEPELSMDNPRLAWEQFVDQLAGKAKLGSFLRLVQQVHPGADDELASLRRERASRVLSPASSVEGFTPFSMQVQELRDLYRATAGELTDPGSFPQRITTVKEYRVALVGAFSAGKSTLINAMLRRQLLPEMNMACTPCPTVVHTAKPGDEKLLARLMSRDELTSAVQVVMGRLGLSNPELDSYLIEGNWQALHRALRTAGDEMLVSKERTALDEFLVPVLDAASRHHRILGGLVELPLDQLKLLRAGKDVGQVPQILLRELEVWAHCPGSVPGLCLIDTPGVTSQNPAHKDAAFKVVDSCHVLLVVESFDAPLIKGPDELMDAFYSKVVRYPSAARGDEKVFVVLNKCDQAPMGEGGIPSPEIDETLEKVAHRYTTAWGVPEERIYAISALCAFEEVSGLGRGIPDYDVDMLLMFFRHFQASLERYILDRLVKASHLDELDDLADRIKAQRLTLGHRIEMLDANSVEQAALMSQQASAEQAVRDSLRKAGARIDGVAVAREREFLDSLRAVCHGLQQRTLAELRAELLDFELRDDTFVRWMDAVLHDELARSASAALSTWGRRRLPRLVCAHLEEVASDIKRELAQGHEQLVASELLDPNVDIPLPELPQAFHSLTGVETLRSIWDTLGVKGKKIRALENKLQRFFVELQGLIVGRLDSVAAEMATSCKQHALFQVELLGRSLEESLVQAREDLQRSFYNLDEQKEGFRHLDAVLAGQQKRIGALRDQMTGF